MSFNKTSEVPTIDEFRNFLSDFFVTKRDKQYRNSTSLLLKIITFYLLTKRITSDVFGKEPTG